MGKVRIVGGGLTGVLAAFEARRLGAQDIELFERFEGLGGALLPRVRNGLELRDRCFYFGGPDDPARRVLEWGGASFSDFEARGGSISPGARGGPVAAPDVWGSHPAAGVAHRSGETLADRLRALPAELEGPLARYCQWRLRAWMDEAHASFAVLLGVAGEPWQADGLASTPKDGFAGLFRTCRRRLEGLGVKVRCGSLASPREILAETGPDDVTVWAADPTALFPAFGLPAARRLSPHVASYVYKARFQGAPPFVLRSFTCAGAAFSVHVYESRGETLAAIECAAEIDDAGLRRDVQGLMTAFGREGLVLGECLAADLRTMSDCLSMDAWRKLGALRFRLADRMGGRFIAGPWEAHGAAGRLAELRPPLAAALAPQAQQSAAAA